MQGLNPNYPGDSNIHDNRVQLQIHYVKCKDKTGNETARTTALAIYFPEDERLNISYIVRGEP